MTLSLQNEDHYGCVKQIWQELTSMINIVEFEEQKNSKHKFLGIKAITCHVMPFLVADQYRIIKLSHLVTKKIQMQNPDIKVNRITVQKRLYDISLVLSGLGMIQIEDKKFKAINYQIPAKILRQQFKFELKKKQLEKKKRRVEKLRELVKESKRIKQNLGKLIKTNMNKMQEEDSGIEVEKIDIRYLCLIRRRSFSPYLVYNNRVIVKNSKDSTDGISSLKFLFSQEHSQN